MQLFKKTTVNVKCVILGTYIHQCLQFHALADRHYYSTFNLIEKHTLMANLVSSGTLFHPKHKVHSTNNALKRMVGGRDDMFTHF